MQKRGNKGFLIALTAVLLSFGIAGCSNPGLANQGRESYREIEPSDQSIIDERINGFSLHRLSFEKEYNDATTSHFLLCLKTQAYLQTIIRTNHQDGEALQLRVPEMDGECEKVAQ